MDIHMDQAGLGMDLEPIGLGDQKRSKNTAVWRRHGDGLLESPDGAALQGLNCIDLVASWAQLDQTATKGKKNMALGKAQESSLSIPSSVGMPNETEIVMKGQFAWGCSNVKVHLVGHGSRCPAKPGEALRARVMFGELHPVLQMWAPNVVRSWFYHNQANLLTPAAVADLAIYLAAWRFRHVWHGWHGILRHINNFRWIFFMRARQILVANQASQCK